MTSTGFDNHRFIDRASGQLHEETFFASGTFSWLYRSDLGRRLRDRLTGAARLHRWLGGVADHPWSRLLIGILMRAGHIDLAEAAEPPGSYRSLNDFFTRRLKPGCRPIDADERSLVSPADGKLLVLPIRDPGQLVSIKGVTTRLGDILASERLARHYLGGDIAIVRLYLGDCHRFHFPTSGVASPARSLPGSYYPVSPFPGNDVDYYGRNHRTVTELASEHLGHLAIVMIGGFLISSIRPSYRPGPVAKGDEHGSFAFGGSTLVLFSEAGAVRYDRDLVDNSRRGLETYLRMGTRIGVGR